MKNHHRQILLFWIFLLSASAAISEITPASHDDMLVRVFIFAEGESIAQLSARRLKHENRAASRQEQRQRLSEIAAEQLELRTRIAPWVQKEHSALRVALNGFRATVRRQDLTALRAVAGVRAVTPLVAHRIDNIYSVPWIEAPKIWDNYGNGEGITIAVIDTGIDYLHANFGGAGVAGEYTKNNPDFIEPGTFPTGKVIGGWDFAGPTYDSREEADPQPDPDPLDVNGHGSHVAGTAAGLGVATTVGPGAAHGATLLALKVFSDIGGSTDLVVDAIEMALDPDGDGLMDDHVDVINMSLGARFGLPTDASAIAAGNAMEAGVIVVASAGNNGDIPYVTGAPGVSLPVISVAATTSGDRRQIALATVLSGTSDPATPPVLQARRLAAQRTPTALYAALEGSGPVRINHTPLSAALVIAQSSPAGRHNDSMTACEPLSNADDVAGKLALAWRGDCNFRTKYQHVQQAGAAGIVVVNTSDQIADLFVMGGLVDDIFIPGLMITGSSGEVLREILASGQLVGGKFSTQFTVPAETQLNNVLAGFSSRGPGAGGSVFKPDIAAPGRLIVSTAAGSGTLGSQKRGTSMAAPHVAGIAALLRQQHPDLSPAAIKSLLQNPAAPSRPGGPGTATLEPLTGQGTGVVRGAHASLLRAYTLPAAVSFAYINPLLNQTLHRSVELHNLEPRARIYQGSHTPVVQAQGVEVICPSSVAVDGSGHSSFTVTMNIVATQLPADDGRMSQTEVSGWCELQEGKEILKVAYLAALDGASQIRLESGENNITLSNHGPVAGLANSFLLAATAKPGSGRAHAINAVGWRRNTLFTFPLLEIAIVMNQTWENPSNLRWLMLLDVDFDQQYERALFATDWSQLGFDPGSIVTGLDYVADPEDIGSERSVSNWFAEDVDYNDRVITLPFFMTKDGVYALFKPGETEFNFRLIAANRYGEIAEVSGYINLLNPQADAFEHLTLSPGESITLPPARHDRLWLLPTNPDQDQSAITRGPGRRSIKPNAESNTH